MVEETLYNGSLVGLVEDDERSLELRLGRVLEVVDVLTDDLPVGDEVALSESTHD